MKRSGRTGKGMQFSRNQWKNPVLKSNDEVDRYGMNLSKLAAAWESNAEKDLDVNMYPMANISQ